MDDALHPPSFLDACEQQSFARNVKWIPQALALIIIIIIINIIIIIIIIIITITIIVQVLLRMNRSLLPIFRHYLVVR